MATASTANQRVADRYVLKAPLGRGGMGVVWRAEDTLLRREVAVKEIEFPRALGAGQAAAVKQRAMREARSAAALSHPNVVTIYDVIQDEGRAFIVMEFIEAPTLAQLITRDGPMTPPRTAEVGLEVLAALEVAHAAGIIHRDVKPANVMIAERAVKLADFGIATVKDDPKITATGMVLGSPQFMAPEQAEGSGSGPAADLWSLGTTLYYAVEGRYPFDRGEPIPTLAAVVHDEPLAPRQAGSLEPVIGELLQKDPLRRPDIARVRRMLRAVVSPSANGAPAMEPPRPSVRKLPRRHAIPKRALVAGLAACVVVAAVVIFTLTRGDGEGGAPEQDVAGPEGSGRAEISVPASWQSYRNPDSGFRLSYPPTWDIVPVDDSLIDFRHPDNGTYLRVDWTDTPGDSPEAAWEQLAQSFAATHDDYNELGIEPTTFKGYDAATWEFTYSEGGASLHAVDLGFVTGPYGFALNFQTHAENWTASQGLFRTLKAGFEAPE